MSDMTMPSRPSPLPEGSQPTSTSHRTSSVPSPAGERSRGESSNGPQIVCICPFASKINGGIKYLFRMVEVLRRLGHDAAIFESQGLRPAWFDSDAPIVPRAALEKREDQLVVVPEDLSIVLERYVSWPQRKVMYCQNQFYAALTAPDGGSYADFGVSDVLCSGRAVYDYCRHRHPRVTAHLIPCGIDSELFRPRSKRERIAFIPRKRPVEGPFIRDLFRFRYPEFRDIEWLPLDGKSEREVAAALGESSVFLALNRLDGFGLTPIEAMSSGCVVAGFTGIGGLEYATEANGFWAKDDDFSACVRQVAEAVRLSRETGARREAYSAACARTISLYTPAIFADAIGAAWAKILTHHA